MIDLITGHQGFAHITAEQVANVNNAMTAGYGDNAVLRLKDGAVTSTGLSIGVGTGYWRANGFDAEITSAETIYVDPSSVGTSRIDKFYIEILQDIPSGNQRAELVYVKGTEASVPTPPSEPTAPALTTDIMLQCVCYASAVIQENSLTLTDLTKTIQNVTPEDMTLVKSWIRDNANVYSQSMPYYRGEVVITPLDGKIYVCDEFCSANTWENNQSYFTEKTILDILSEIGKQSTEIHKYGTCVTAAATTEKKINTEYGDFKLEIGRGVYAKFSYANTASAPTLKVDSTTAKTIKGYGSTNPSSWWKAGDIVHFVYDGTNFIMLPTQGQVDSVNQALTNSLHELVDVSNKFTAASGVTNFTVSYAYRRGRIVYFLVGGTIATYGNLCKIDGSIGTWYANLMIGSYAQSNGYPKAVCPVINNNYVYVAPDNSSDQGKTYTVYGMLVLY